MSEEYARRRVRELVVRIERIEAALDAAAIALENQAHSAGSWHEDEMRMDAARDAGKAARAALRDTAPAEEHPKCCRECGGSGRYDNHVTGEVECGACEGSGVAAPGEVGKP
jgi:hypothetical protein